jgi:hypothetical protein
MAKGTVSFRTGTLVKEPGIYACTGFKDGGQCPGKIETSVPGPVFPPPHCAGSRWRLVPKPGPESPGKADGAPLQ